MILELARQALVLIGMARTRGSVEAEHGLTDRFTVVCRDRHGNVKWEDTFKNLVVNQGLNDNLTRYFKGSNYTASWFVGLISGTPTIVATNTMASHPGWTEVQSYSEATRPPITWGTVANQAVDSTAAPARFTINANNVVLGGVMITTANNKGGTTGVLYAAGVWSTGNNKVLDNGDTLDVSVAASAVAV